MFKISSQMIFNGRQFALQLESQLQGKLIGKKVIAILDPENLSGLTYTKLKQKTAERLGVDFEIREDFPEIQDVDGIMVQLPHPKAQELIARIEPSKDIDGLRNDSPFRPAVVIAVLKILQFSFTTSLSFPLLNSGEGGSRRMGEVVIVGSKGEVGRRLIKEIPGAIGIDKEDSLDILKDADVIISATGQAGLIKPEMVKEGVIAIDVGFPRGDFDPSTSLRASFFTPVPGGVGPVTVVCLFENLVSSDSEPTKSQTS